MASGAQPGGHGAQPKTSKEVWVGMRVHHWKTKRAATVAALDQDPNGTHFLLHFDDEWPEALGGMAWRRIAAFVPEQPPFPTGGRAFTTLEDAFADLHLDDRAAAARQLCLQLKGAK